jgi:sugar lactone lactonase YvrE
MNFLINPSTFLLLMLLTSCGNNGRDSSDFTPEFSFTPGIEGPAVNKEGDLFAVNFQKEGTIGKVSPDGKAEIFLSLPDESIGNGIRFDALGDMFIADYVGHRIYRVPKGKNRPEVWAQDSSMNQPNDLAISPKGIIYLSDPKWADNTGQLWMVGPERKMVLLEDNMGTTNGIEVSPDNGKLYVNESVQRKVWEYNILEDGSLANKRVLIVFEDHGLDGMRCDSKGNLYIARYGKGTVAMVSPEGEILREFRLKGKKPSNLTFGGKNGKSCFVTMADRGCIETFKAPFPGSYYTQVQK